MQKKNGEPETESSAPLPLTKFTQKPQDIMKAQYWIKQWFYFLQDMADVRKHIIGVYADASRATKHVKTGNDTYEEVPDWKTRIDSAHKMDEWYEKTVNLMHKAAQAKDSPVDTKEFDALGAHGMVSETYKRIREAGTEGASEADGESIAS